MKQQVLYVMGSNLYLYVYTVRNKKRAWSYAFKKLIISLTQLFWNVYGRTCTLAEVPILVILLKQTSHMSVHSRPHLQLIATRRYVPSHNKLELHILKNIRALKYKDRSINGCPSDWQFYLARLMSVCDRRGTLPYGGRQSDSACESMPHV